MIFNKKKIIEYTIYIIVLVLIAWGTPVVLKKVLNTKYPVATITSSSMWPALKKGDLILVKGVKEDELKVGDVVVYKTSERLVVHRIKEMEEERIVTRGDANNVDDQPIYYEMIVGRVIGDEKPFRIPFLGKVSMFLYK